ncbi:tetratricopeptide repeat protein [Nocardia neocaledoniensis]|uniref:tetratricopeptide repeat protein n=1 Tax=Nocardia neocaledoniensis TaxID=236511 RepID=UPI002454E0A5|nr:tetratricopeptide repeat protein [Nocardia neocaledoniensis]
MAVTARNPGTERPYRFDERLRMIPADPETLAARVAVADPDDFGGLRRLGIALMLLGRHAEALDRLDQALELADTEGRRITVWINLADVYRYQGESTRAEILYRRALEASRALDDPELVSFAAHHLGKSLAEQHRTAEARDMLKVAMRLRVAEGDSELIESTRAALDHLAELALPLPPEITALLGETPVWSDDHEGRGGNLVRAEGYWIKRGPRAVAEYERLNWLRDKGIAVPEVAAFAEDVLVLADTGTRSLADATGDAAEVGALLGRTLRALHALPVADCPFDARLEVTLAQARRNVVEGFVDTADFDGDHRDLAPETVHERLVTQRPDQEDLVVTHGDFTPGNVLAGGTLIDVGALGRADRYRDLALAERDLSGDFGVEAVVAFFTAYGLTAPERAKLEYYRLLDELF